MLSLSHFKAVSDPGEGSSDAQPPGNASNRVYRVAGPRRRRGRIKIVPRNVSQAQEVEETYLGRANADAGRF